MLQDKDGFRRILAGGRKRTAFYSRQDFGCVWLIRVCLTIGTDDVNSAVFADECRSGSSVQSWIHTLWDSGGTGRRPRLTAIEEIREHDCQHFDFRGQLDVPVIHNSGAQATEGLASFTDMTRNLLVEEASEDMSFPR